MLFDLFRTRPLLDADTTAWIYDLFAWSFTHLDADIFREHTRLVLPTNDHFPGRSTSPHEMAALIFDKVRDYAGMGHWPLRLVEPIGFQPPMPANLRIEGPLRAVAAAPQSGPVIPIQYAPQMVRNPEALIAAFAHVLAQLLVSRVPTPPPGGEENLPHATELIGVFLGFGVEFANTAFNVRVTSCGGCQGNVPERESYLSQYDITYALALFCTLKQIPPGAAAGHLKSSLRPFFRKAMKEIARSKTDLERLRQA